MSNDQTSQQPETAKELTRDQKLALIYRHTHRDYKGIAGERWGKDAGKKSILINVNGATALTLLEHLTDEQIADKLPYALKQEAKRLAEKKEKSK